MCPFTISLLDFNGYRQDVEQGKRTMYLWTICGTLGTLIFCTVFQLKLVLFGGDRRIAEPKNTLLVCCLFFERLMIWIEIARGCNRLFS